VGQSNHFQMGIGLLDRRDLRNLLIFEIAFFFAYKYGMNLSATAGAPFWFPDSVLLCALLLSRPAIWWIYIVAPLPLRLFVAVTPGLPGWFLLLAFANDSLKGLVGAYLTRQALRGRKIKFDSLPDLWSYLLAAVVLAPVLSGFAGASAWLALGHEFFSTWWKWCLGDALANLVFTPLLLCLAQDWSKFATARAARYLEGLALFSALPFAAHFAYTRGMGRAGLVDPFGYIPLPFLVWAAVRFGPAGASAALSIMSVLSVAAAGANQLEVVGHVTIDATLSIQLFIVVLAIPILLLSVLVEQQRRTEESLRESEERFRSMANAAPVMIWVSGLDKLRSFFNKGWLTFTGHTLEKELGFGWVSGLHPDDRDRCLSTYASSFDARSNFQMEYRLRRADGEYRWLLDSGIPRLAPDMGFAGYIGSCIDITDVKRAQENSLARQKLECIGVLAGGIAHDFNNLLGSILVLAELATTELASGVSPNEELQRIQAVASRGSEIVRELMIYSGQDKVDLERIDVSQLVEETMELIKVSVSKHSVLRTDLKTNLPSVQGSPAQIRQIVMNLIINASEAIGEKGGVINVTTSRVFGGRDLAPNNIADLPGGEYLRLAVSDTGCGMPEAAKAKVFDPFFTTKFAGRGMGLAVVQGIARDLRGAINLVSAPGEGTTFEIFLPCSGENAQSSPVALAQNAGPEAWLPSGTVLFVEDETDLRVAVSKMLRRKGFEVIEAIDGTSAIELMRARQSDIDVMLLDVTLPGLSSREVFIQAQQECPNLIVILTSAYSRESVQATFAGLRIEHYIRKPFQFTDLMGMLQDALS
jgi:PAS domain S-box-containing protein